MTFIVHFSENRELLQSSGINEPLSNEPLKATNLHRSSAWSALYGFDRVASQVLPKTIQFQSLEKGVSSGLQDGKVYNVNIDCTVYIADSAIADPFGVQTLDPSPIAIPSAGKFRILNQN